MSREKNDDEITQTTFLRLEGDAKMRDASYKVDLANKKMAEAIKDVMKDDVPTIKARMKSAPPPVEAPDYGKHSFSSDVKACLSIPGVIDIFWKHEIGRTRLLAVVGDEDHRRDLQIKAWLMAHADDCDIVQSRVETSISNGISMRKALLKK